MGALAVVGVLAAGVVVRGFVIGRETTLPSGRKAHILRRHIDTGVSAATRGAYGTALVISFCAAREKRDRETEQREVLQYVEQEALARGATTVIVDRHESPNLLFFGCGPAQRSAYVYDGEGEWHGVVDR